jgi:hypothetical protein
MVPYSLVVRYQHFGGTYCPHLQGQRRSHVGGNMNRNIEEEEGMDGIRSLCETGPKINCFVNGNIKQLI